MLSIISIYDNEKWDSVVKSFKNYDVYYLSGYSKAFHLHGDGEPILIYYEDSNIRAINTVMIRDIEKDVNFINKLPSCSYFDITTPYGYGGFLIEGKITEECIKHLDDEFSTFFKSKGVISEFVRFHPILKNDEVLDGVYEISRLGKTISMDLNSKEQIWNNMTSKNHNMVRKAQKAGVEIFWGRNLELFGEFIQQYNTIMERDGAKRYYFFEKDFYSSILNDLKYNALIFYAIYKKRIIAMSIILFANQQMHYHLSASDINYRQLAPTNLLLYEAALWGYEIGCKTFHLGGGVGSREDNLYKFKSAFNRNSYNTFNIGRKIFDEYKYKELVTMRTVESLKTYNTKVRTEDIINLSDDYFPKYRC